jgi:hypothetical protein
VAHTGAGGISFIVSAGLCSTGCMSTYEMDAAMKERLVSFVVRCWKDNMPAVTPELILRLAALPGDRMSGIRTVLNRLSRGGFFVRLDRDTFMYRPITAWYDKDDGTRLDKETAEAFAERCYTAGREAERGWDSAKGGVLPEEADEAAKVLKAYTRSQTPPRR